MNRDELEKILNDIAEQTGTRAYLSSQGGEETAFDLDYCGERFTAFLPGTGEDAERTANLLRYLIGQSRGEKTDLKSILLGEGDRQSAYRYLMRCGLHDGPCYCLDILLPRHRDEAAAHLESCLSEMEALIARMEADRFAVVVFRDEAQLPVELGNFLAQSLYEELGVKAGIGIGCETKTFAEISRSYAQAAAALRMSGLLRSKGEVHTYREYLLVKLIEDVPEGRLKEHMEQFQITGAEEVFSDEEMMGTAETFFENSLNLSETARDLYIHRNTLMYRLDKIERLTGLNIRKFSDAVTFRIMTIFYRMLRE